MGITTDPERTAELWVRSHVPAGIDRDQHALVERLESLVGRGLLSELSVRSWGREAGLARTATRAPETRIVLDRVASFRAWAGRSGHSLAPFFRTREREATVTGEAYTAQVLPVRALVEYRDGEVVHVAPSIDPGGDPVDVRDRIDTLEAVVERPADDPDRPLATSGGEG